jgi:hypothetical protein
MVNAELEARLAQFANQLLAAKTRLKSEITDRPRTEKSLYRNGCDPHVEPKTVSTYQVRLLEKMNLKTNADLIRYAIENGLLE